MQNEILGKCVQKFERIAQIIERNLYHQREKVEDAKSIAMAMVDELRRSEAALSTDAEPVAFVVRHDLENGGGSFCDERNGIIQDHLGHWQNADVALYAEPVKTAPAVAVKSPFEFDRYINGALMAEGVTIENADTLGEAAAKAAKIASRGSNGEVPVLALRSALSAQVQDAAGERWIDVNDKLPGEQGQDSEEVSVFLNGHCGLLDHDKRKGGSWGYRTGFYDADIGCFRVHGRPDRFVTHWMPLPASPAFKHGNAE